MKKTFLIVCVFLAIFSIVSASALDVLSSVRSMFLPFSLVPSYFMQQQTLQILSNIAKIRQEMTMATVRKIGG